jgi:Protein of unknown function (DUF3768)
MSQTSQMTIAELNDRFRQHNLGFGQVVMTPMVKMMPSEQQAVLLEMVKSFNEFSEGNDPHAEHDCGGAELQGEDYLWKIDYYDSNYEYGAEDPGDPSTRRVLTVMHSSEY